jgi:hypothetical protein
MELLSIPATWGALLLLLGVGWTMLTVHKNSLWTFRGTLILFILAAAGFGGAVAVMTYVL